MSMIANRRAWLLAAASLAAQACARDDVTLGTLGAPAGSGSAEMLADAAGSTAAGSSAALVGPVGDPAGAGISGTGTGGAAGVVPDVPTPPDAGSSGMLADAGALPSVARPSPGCGKEPVLTDTSITVAQQEVSYLLDLPAAYDKTRAYALVLAFHGSDLSAEQFRTALDLAPVAGADAIIAYPDPLNPQLSWDFQRDMASLPLLLAKLGDSFCIDLDRVFALGDGSGSLFVNLVGCVRGDQVRAIAPLSNSPPPLGPCSGNTAVWLFQQSDAIPPSQVGAGLGNRDFWADRNACDVTRPVATAGPGCVEYAGCEAGYPVRYCEFRGDGSPSRDARQAWTLFLSL